MKTKDFLTAITQQAGVSCTGYQLAKLMGTRYGWSRSACYNYIRGNTCPDDRQAIDIASELDLPPAFVIASIHAERESAPEVRKVWQGIAKMLERSAAAVIMAGVGFLASAGISAPYVQAAYSPDYTLGARRRGLVCA